MALALEDADKILRPLIRSISKRADYTMALAEGDRPGVAVTLSMHNRSETVTIPVTALTAAEQSAMRRHQLKTKLKHTLDRMLFVANQVASTKMLRPMTQADGFFRPRSGNQGRR